MQEFASRLAAAQHVLKFRLHLFEPYDDDYGGLDARGLSHSKPRDKQCQAMCEIAFREGFEAFVRSAIWMEMRDLQPTSAPAMLSKST